MNDFKVDIEIAFDGMEPGEMSEEDVKWFIKEHMDSAGVSLHVKKVERVEEEYNA